MALGAASGIPLIANPSTRNVSVCTCSMRAAALGAPITVTRVELASKLRLLMDANDPKTGLTGFCAVVAGGASGVLENGKKTQTNHEIYQNRIFRFRLHVHGNSIGLHIFYDNYLAWYCRRKSKVPFRG